MGMFGEEIIDRLNENCSLRNTDNPARQVIIDTIGAWFDNYNDERFEEQFFIQEADGKYLDIHGQMYNVYRQNGESDTDYLDRIIYETLEHLTANYLLDVYNVGLYSHVDNFNFYDNTMVSDNPYLFTDNVMGEGTDIVQNILSKKFILDNNFYWLHQGSLDYIIDNNGNNLLDSSIYSENMINFADIPHWNRIVQMSLNLPNALRVEALLCNNLTDLKLFLPNVIKLNRVTEGCQSLRRVTIYAPESYSLINLFGTRYPVDLKYLNLRVRQDKFDEVKEYVQGLTWNNLSSFTLNGIQVSI